MPTYDKTLKQHMNLIGTKFQLFIIERTNLHFNNLLQ